MALSETRLKPEKINHCSSFTAIKGNTTFRKKMQASVNPLSTPLCPVAASFSPARHYGIKKP